MKTIYISTIILILIIFFLYTKKKEHLSALEAVNNISKIYADASGTVIFNNVKTIGNVNAGGSIDISGYISGSNVTITNADAAGIGGRIDLINPQKNRTDIAKKWSFINMNSAPGTYTDGLELWKYDGVTGSGSRQFNFKDNGNFSANSISVNDYVSKKQNRARYLRIGNAWESSGISRENSWTIKEVEVYDHAGNNIAKNKPVSVISGTTAYPGNSTWGVPGNIVNGDSKAKDGGDYHGGDGINELEIDLGQEYDIYQIIVYNRYHSSYVTRANNTSIRLLDSSKNLNRVIYTGNWLGTYSKEYIL